MGGRVGPHPCTAVFMADTPLDTALDANATGPRSVTIDGSSTVQHPLPDQIAAAKFKRSRDAIDQPAGGKVLGIRMFKLRPPGTA